MQEQQGSTPRPGQRVPPPDDVPMERASSEQGGALTATEIRRDDDSAIPGTQGPREGAYHYARPQARRGMDSAGIVQALGWFSVGLGLAQLLAPRQMSRAIGAGDHPHMMRACGTRELASGIGILTQRRPATWLWSRVAGDALDLFLLGAAARSPHARRTRIGMVGAAVAGIAVLDLLTSMKAPEHQALGEEVEFEKTIVVNRSPEECYRYWRDLEGLPRFMHHLREVHVIDEKRSLWRAKGPLGFSIEWHSEITDDEPNEYIAWRSEAGSDIDTEGSVRFTPAPSGRGTLVYTHMRYRPPGGAAGYIVSKLFGDEPSQQIDEELRRFKWLLETGEIPTTVGQPAGQRGAWNRYVIRKGAAG
ncbi:MAG TPA: SRPBCC family protein [Noviherbaspirillum sp.]|nr:SRPBCC family protein [Noviherbaspirillum sp.]